MKEWRVSWDAWAHGWPRANRTERVYASEADALAHYEGLKMIEAPHELRPCDEHVWAIRLEVRNSPEWSLSEAQPAAPMPPTHPTED